MNSHTRYLIITLLAIAAPVSFLSQSLAGSIYRVVDEQGRVSFTDKPPTDKPSTIINLRTVNTHQGVELPPPAAATTKGKDEHGHNDTKPVKYTSASISAPAPDTTVPPGQTSIMIKIALKPALQEGHLVQLYHNNSALGGPVATQSISLGNLQRGQHEVRANILGADGKVTARTKTVIFHVKRFRPKNRN